MEIVDSFCGIGPWSGRDTLLPYSADDVLEQMDYFGISRALVHANIAADRGRAPAANTMVAEAAAGQERFLPAFTLAPHPHDGSPTPQDYARSMAEAGARAAWIWPHPGGFLTWVLEGCLSMCVERRIPLFLHAEHVGPDVVHTVCSEFPDLRVVLVGAGYGSDTWLYPLLRKHPNIHVCLGHFYIPSGGPGRFLRHFPAERLIFGSGLPKFSPGGLIGHVMYADLEDSVLEKIMGGNLMRLLSEAQL